MTLADAATFANDYSFRHNTVAAAVRVALNVMEEDTATPGHADRIELATLVLAEPGLYADRLSWAVSANDDLVADYIAGNTEDVLNALEEAVADVWDHLSGVEPTE